MRREDHAAISTRKKLAPSYAQEKKNGGDCPLAGGTIPDSDKMCIVKVNAAVADTITKPQLDKAKVMANFKKYCMECHLGDDALYELPLGSDDFSKLKAYRSKEEHKISGKEIRRLSVLERLQGVGGKMPPDVAQEHPSVEEMDEMIRALQILE
jgi:hypothetical protein